MIRHRYDQPRALGKGAMGSVYRVKDVLSATDVALKALWPGAAEQALLRSLRAEFSTLAHVRHPLLCRVFDFGRLPPDCLPGAPEGEPGYFLTRELVEGQSLGEAFGDPARLEVGAVCAALAQACRGLDVLHQSGLRHGDFKPSNAVLGDDGSVRLIDFGLAGREHSSGAFGTLPFMAPELLLGSRADRRADLYAVGVSVFVLCSGSYPSGDLRGAALASWHTRGARPRLSETVRVPASLDVLVARLLAIDPSERPPNAVELALALEQCAVDAGSVIASPSAPAELVLPVVAPGRVRPLEHAFEARSQKQPHSAVVELVGGPGSGRTTLLQELAWRAQLAGAEVVRVPAASEGLETAWRQLAAISGRPPPEASEPPVYRAALRMWLESITSDFPVVLIFDDLDDGDPFARSLLEYLALSVADGPALLVVAAPEPEGPGLGGQVIELAPISLGDIDTLLFSLRGSRDSQLAAQIAQHTGGNLLHLHQTLEVLAQRGYSRIDIDALPPPARLGRLDAERLADLSPAQRATVYAMAVLDQPATPELLEGILAEPPVASAVVDCDALGRWSLRPARVRASVRKQIGAARQRELHRQVDAQLARGGASAARRLRYWVGGEMLDELRRSALLALEELWAQAHWHDALALGTGACEVLARAGIDLDERLPMLVRLGELAQLANDTARTEELLVAVVEQGNTEAPLHRRAHLALARAREQTGRLDAAAEMLALLSTGEDEVAARATSQLAQLHIRAGHYADALECIERALAKQPEQGVRRELAIASAFAAGSLGRDPSARQTLQDIADQASGTGDAGSAAAAWHYRGRIAFSEGDYLEARADYERALRAARQSGDVSREGILRMNLAAMDFSFGDYAGSRRHYVMALSFLRAAGVDTFAILCQRNYGHLLLELGQWEQARAALRQAQKAARRAGLTVHDIGIDALLGLLAWRAGDIDTGRRRLEDARRRFQALGDARRSAETLLDLVELELEASMADGARKEDAAVLLEAAAAIPETLADRARRVRYLALRSWLCALQGDETGGQVARDDLRDAMTELREQGGHQLGWEVHRLAARAAEAAGLALEASRHRREALDLLEASAEALSESDRLAFWQDPRRRWLRAASVPRTGGTAPSLARSSSSFDLSDKLFRLLAIYRRLFSERDLERLLELVMDTAIELSRAERGFLLLHDSHGRLRVEVTRNLPSAVVASLAQWDESRGASAVVDGSVDASVAVPFSRSIAEVVLASGDPVVTADAQSDPRFDEARSVAALRVRAVACVPVHSRGQVVGVLYLEGRMQELGDDELRVLMAFGDQVAVVLENARLLAENRQRAEALHRAHEEIAALLAERTQLLEERTEELAGARRDLAGAQRRMLGARGAFGLVGRSPAMERVFQILERIAGTSAPVLVLGESGTGKELIARALHQHGPRREHRMVAINCGALPESVLESELFGHERGAFTGADRTRKGLFESASHGTLFLDEIGETSPRMQASLLRALQEGIIRRVGGTEDIRVDVRVVAATNRSLQEMVQRGEFREDLFYRLHVLPLELPPLRERAGDVPLLVQFFLERLAEQHGGSPKRLTRRALQKLSEHHWPGNVRQLEHALTSAAVMAESNVLDTEDFEAVLRASIPVSSAAREVLPATTEHGHKSVERQSILSALEASGWNRSEAARILGMPRRTFYRRLRDYDIQ